MKYFEGKSVDFLQSMGTTRLRLRLTKRSHRVHELHWDWKAKGIYWRPNYQETPNAPQGTLLLIKIKIVSQWGHGYRFELGHSGFEGAGRIHSFVFSLSGESKIYICKSYCWITGSEHVTSTSSASSEALVYVDRPGGMPNWEHVMIKSNTFMQRKTYYLNWGIICSKIFPLIYVGHRWVCTHRPGVWTCDVWHTCAGYKLELKGRVCQCSSHQWRRHVGIHFIAQVGGTFTELLLFLDSAPIHSAMYIKTFSSFKKSLN